MATTTLAQDVSEPHVGRTSAPNAMHADHDSLPELPEGILDEIVDRAPVVIFVKDRRGRYLLVNRRFEELVGLPRSSILGKTDHDLFPRHEADRFRKDDEDAGRTERLLQRMEYVSQNGETHEYVSTKFSSRDATGTLRAVCGVAVDVTASTRAQETLRRSNSMLVATLESTADGILVVDCDGRVVQCNQRFLDIWRVPEEAIRGHEDAPDDTAIVSQLEDPEAFLSRVRHLYAHPELHSLDTVRFKDGRTIERFSQPQYLEGEIVGRVWSFRDVTSRVRAERHRDRLLDDERKARAEAEEAVRLRDEFLDIAAHELRTPMTSLKLTLQSLQKRLARGLEMDRARTLTALSVRQLRRLEVLVDMMLDVTHLHGGRLELDRTGADLRAICVDVLAQLGDEIGRSGSQVTIHGPRWLSGPWDGFRLEQAVTNLLTNAIKFGRGNPIDIDLESDGTTATLRIRDRGVGIPSELRATLFQRFARGVSWRHYGGLGLGLYITRNIVEAHGGTIDVTSEPEVGSEFVVRLPLHGATTSGGAEPENEPGDP